MPAEPDPPQAPVQAPFVEQITRWLLMFFSIQFVMKKGQEYTSTVSPMTPTSVENNNATMATMTTMTTKKSPHRLNPNHMCLWNSGVSMDLDVYFSDSPDLKIKKNVIGSWHEKDLVLGSESERSDSISIGVTSGVINNDTHIYAHVMLTNKEVGKEDERRVLYKKVLMTKHKLRKKSKNVKNLLDSGQENGAASSESSVDEADRTELGLASQNLLEDVTLLYLKPSLTLQLVDMYGPVPRGSLPPQVLALMNFADDDVTSDFYPTVHPSEFWIKTDNLIPVNATLDRVDIDVKLTAVKMWKWQLMAQMETQWETQQDSESDMLRTVLQDTNPYLLVITALVSLLHTVFDFLAFKNDISFFKGKKSMEGLSLRTMIINAFFQIVIFLYLIDNDTSYMVVVSNGIGLVIEFWKISKTLSIEYAGNGKFTWTQDKTYSQSKTKEYDEIATSHLLFVTMPLVTGYGAYSLLYMKHKGWYSWGLGTLVGFIYMFGFVMMTPQLFINYKFKSVAHLNWRTMSYKSVNTFIDDLFAFVIKMPIMHRLACLRDDVVFFIFLYQRWIYNIDYTRVNEYGQCVQPTEEMLKEQLILEEKNGINANDDIVIKEDAVITGDGEGIARRGAKEKAVNHVDCVKPKRRGAREKND